LHVSRKYLPKILISLAVLLILSVCLEEGCKILLGLFRTIPLIWSSILGVHLNSHRTRFCTGRVG
jgi:hypothetical protein